jgi:hypothetical protein
LPSSLPQPARTTNVESGGLAGQVCNSGDEWLTAR